MNKYPRLCPFQIDVDGPQDHAIRSTIGNGRPSPSPKTVSSMLAAATSAASAFFKVSAISQNYILTSTNTASYASGSSSRSASPALPQSNSSPFTVGLWRVQEAVHKTNGKRVSVWSFDKKNSALDRLGAPAKERVIQVLKLEVGAIGSLWS